MAAAIAGGAAIVGVAAAVVVVVSTTPAGDTGPNIIVARNLTALDANPGRFPSAVVAEVHAAADHNEGTLTVVDGAEDTAEVVYGPKKIPITVDGDPESDDDTRYRKVEEHLSDAWNTHPKHLPRASARSVLGLLTAIRPLLKHKRVNEVYLMTLGLPTAALENARTLTAADPGQAAAAIPAQAVPSGFHGVHITAVLSRGGIAGQTVLDNVTVTWRDVFVRDLLRRAGSTDITIIDDPKSYPGWTNGPSTPAVPNIHVAPPKVPVVPKLTPKPGRRHPFPAVHLDTAAYFVENRATLRISHQTLRTRLKPIADAWLAAQHAKTPITLTVSGHCAMWGPAAGAEKLSRRRAEVIAAALREFGVRIPDSAVHGYGFRKPVDPPHPRSAANRVVTVSAYSAHT